MSDNFAFEYVSSSVSVLDGDSIVIHVVNDSADSEEAHAMIYQSTGAGATTATDSGTVTLTSTWQWGLGYTISSSGEYWVRVRTSSAALIPKASFERPESSRWVPVVTYRPNDFAVFRLLPARERIW